MIICSWFHGCDIRACISESKTSKNLLNIGLLTQRDSFVLEKVSSDTDSEKPVDVAEVNQFKMLVQLSLSFG